MIDDDTDPVDRPRSGAKDGILDLNQVATYDGFAPLAGVSKQAVKTYADRGIIEKKGTYGEWIPALYEHFRVQSQRHGGDSNEALVLAKTDEVLVKTAIQRIAYNEQIGTLIDSGVAESILLDWAAYAMREAENEINTLAAKIENKLGIDIPNELTDESIGTIRGRVIGHAEQLGERLTEDSEEPEA